MTTKGKRKRIEKKPDYMASWVKRVVLTSVNLSRMDIARLNPDASIEELKRMEVSI